MVASLTYTGGLEEDIEMDIQVGEDRKWEVMRSCNWWEDDLKGNMYTRNDDNTLLFF